MLKCQASPCFQPSRLRVFAVKRRGERALVRRRIGVWIQTPGERPGPYGFEQFTFSSFQLCRRLLTGLGQLGGEGQAPVNQSAGRPKGIRRVSEGVKGSLARFGGAWAGLGGGEVPGRMASNGSGRSRLAARSSLPQRKESLSCGGRGTYSASPEPEEMRQGIRVHVPESHFKA